MAEAAGTDLSTLTALYGGSGFGGNSPVRDRNTGLPITAASNQGYQDTTAQLQSGRTDVATSTTGERAYQSGYQTIGKQNVPTFALTALETLMKSLIGGKDVNQAALAVKYPKATLQSTGGGITYQGVGGTYRGGGGLQYVNPISGMPMTAQEAAAFNAQQEAKIQTEIQAMPTKGPELSPYETRRLNARETELQRNITQQGKYSKEAAGTDAQALMDKALHDALRRTLPQITAASEGAGTSRGSMRALLTQEAATAGAREGAALGAEQMVKYGQLYDQLAGVNELLTRGDPNSPENLLLRALEASKGMIESGGVATGQTTIGSKTTDTRTTQGPSGTIQATDRLPINPFPNFAPSPASPGTTPNQGTNPYYAFAMGDQAAAYGGNVEGASPYADYNFGGATDEEEVY